MDWSRPEERAKLIERVGADEYERLFREEAVRCTVATVNGHAIRTINTRFGLLFSVGATGMAFKTQDEAERFARETSQ